VARFGTGAKRGLAARGNGTIGTPMAKSRDMEMLRRWTPTAGLDKASDAANIFRESLFGVPLKKVILFAFINNSNRKKRNPKVQNAVCLQH